MIEAELSKTIRELELRLLDPTVRSSPAELDRLLADDFVEIGSSGRVWDKQAIVGALRQEEAGTRWAVRSFEVKRLAGDLAHATYEVVATQQDGGSRASMRSSLWTRRDGDWKLWFHQGTRLSEQASTFSAMRLPSEPTVTAPDGSGVRVLLGLARGGMAHFELAAGAVSTAIVHRTVEEIWFIVSGNGQMWRKNAQREEMVDLQPGVCLTIPLGTHFQFRAGASEPLRIVGVTMPPWPGAEEALLVEGPWRPTVG